MIFCMAIGLALGGMCCYLIYPELSEINPTFGFLDLLLKHLSIVGAVSVLASICASLIQGGGFVIPMSGVIITLLLGGMWGFHKVMLLIYKKNNKKRFKNL